jgi:hypothetical protein
VQTEQELAERFAPILYLHPQEQYLPMHADEFVRSSRLWRGRGNRVSSVFDVEAKAWVPDPGGGRLFGVPVDLLSRWDLLHGPDDASWSRRPHDHRFRRRRAVRLEHPRRGRRRPSPRPAAPATTSQPWRGHTLVSYWFFYGFSQFLAWIAHQGDWEHASLVIRKDAVVSGFFAVHEGKYFVEADDLRWRDGRLQIYSAKGRHATWWKAGEHWVGLTFLQDQDRIGNLEPEAVLQDETAAGPAWDLRLNLRPLAGQPWRLFAGARGKVGDAPHATGPLGPWFKRLINPDEKVVLE